MVSMAAAAAAGSQQSSRLSSPSLAPAAKASYQRHDGRFPAFIRTSRHGFEAPIGCPVHAAWPGREFIHQTLGATKPAPDLAREPVRALGGTLELRLIAKAIAMTASKPRSTIQNAASTGTRWARKPSSAVAECCSRNQEVDDLVDNLPGTFPRLPPIGQPDAVRQAEERHGADGLTIARPAHSSGASGLQRASTPQHGDIEGQAAIGGVAGEPLPPSGSGATDTIARMGGDEFAIVQVALSHASDASALAQRIVTAISEPYDIDGHQVVTGTSVGIAVAPTDGTTADQLIKNADLALYRAKGDGRGTFRFFQPGMDAKLQARRALEQELRKALTTGEFELYYQPVIDLASNRISGFEALIRWRHPEKAVGETNEDLMALISAASAITGPGILVPTRNHALFSWCLENRLGLVFQMTLMSIGLYSEPAGAYLPSVLY